MDTKEEARENERVTQLEIKLSYAEDLLETLNQMVAKQQDQIEWLVREVQNQRQRKDDDGQPVFRSLRDDIPPHY